eukprot:CAMPEP_0117425204 /NCGR_PEP_ID=MMETSP0758-20121206/5509_1 /TAXON_ID=63605 /ORGANISM="Percolomonas cosmopolitus, Strain AE-1 (ATCC 50343)" /LENGTH=170 /DNA_ID=CAMNT_0005209521 /DNA_START=364 /DNA_END=876 /DNA_ORIENTATION=+
MTKTNDNEFAVGYEDSVVEFFDERKLGNPIDQFSIDPSKMTTITALSCHAQSTMVVGTANTKGVVLVDRLSKDIQECFSANGKGINCILTDHKRWMLFGGWDNRIHCIDMKKRKQKGLLKYHRGSIHDMIFMDESNEDVLKLASCSEDEHVVLWSIPLLAKNVSSTKKSS